MAYPDQPQPNESAPMPDQPQPYASSPMLPLPATIVGPQYCAPYPLELEIVEKLTSISDGNFEVADVNGNIVFKVKGSHLTLRGRRTMLDASGYPIITLRPKIMTMHDRWEGYRGESTYAKDLIFTLKRSSITKRKTRFDVFLAGNTKESECDFRVKGSWLRRSCKVYAGKSKTIVAQMHKKHTIQSSLSGKDHFMVTVHPHVDFAFVAALVVILDKINADKTQENGAANEDSEESDEEGKEEEDEEKESGSDSE